MMRLLQLQTHYATASVAGACLWERGTFFGCRGMTLGARRLEELRQLRPARSNFSCFSCFSSFSCGQPTAASCGLTVTAMVMVTMLVRCCCHYPGSPLRSRPPPPALHRRCWQQHPAGTAAGAASKLPETPRAMSGLLACWLVLGSGFIPETFCFFVLYQNT
jgi:hypothetical protein